MWLIIWIDFMYFDAPLQSTLCTSRVLRVTYWIKETTTMTKMQGARMITFDIATAASFPLYWEFLLLLLLFLFRLSTRSCIVYFTSSASWGISFIDMTDSSGRQNRNNLNFLQSRTRDSQLKRGVLIKIVIESLACHFSFIFSLFTHLFLIYLLIYFIFYFITFYLFIYLLFIYYYSWSAEFNHSWIFELN